MFKNKFKTDPLSIKIWSKDSYSTYVILGEHSDDIKKEISKMIKGAKTSAKLLNYFGKNYTKRK